MLSSKNNRYFPSLQLHPTNSHIVINKKLQVLNFPVIRKDGLIYLRPSFGYYVFAFFLCCTYCVGDFLIPKTNLRKHPNTLGLFTTTTFIPAHLRKYDFRSDFQHRISAIPHRVIITPSRNTRMPDEKRHERNSPPAKASTHPPHFRYLPHWRTIWPPAFPLLCHISVS